MVYTKIDTAKEERDYRAEVEEVKRWWTQPRFRKIKRCVLFLEEVGTDV